MLTVLLLTVSPPSAAKVTEIPRIGYVNYGANPNDTGPDLGGIPTEYKITGILREHLD